MCINKTLFKIMHLKFLLLDRKNINLHDRKIYKLLFIRHCLNESAVANISKEISDNMHKFEYFSRLKYLFQFGLLYIIMSTLRT